jgi:uncharacterized protein (TIGR02588 family)
MKKKKLEKNWLEWAVFVVGLVLVLSALVYLAYDGATLGDAPPRLEVRTGTPEQQPHSYVVPVSVINHGDQTAEGVQIEVILLQGGEEKERSEFSVAFVPRGSTREGWVAFQTDPRAAEQIKARVLGYEKP